MSNKIKTAKEAVADIQDGANHYGGRVYGLRHPRNLN